MKPRLAGQTGKEHSSVLVAFLERVLGGSIDVQCGSGFLSYIDGYVTKEHDSLSFSLSQHSKKEEH